jgi:hypothetical protein
MQLACRALLFQQKQALAAFLARSTAKGVNISDAPQGH